MSSCILVKLKAKEGSLSLPEIQWITIIRARCKKGREDLFKILPGQNDGNLFVEEACFSDLSLWKISMYEAQALSSFEKIIRFTNAA